MLNGVNGVIILTWIPQPWPQHPLNFLLNSLLKYFIDDKGGKEQGSEQRDAGSRWQSSLWFSNLD